MKFYWENLVTRVLPTLRVLEEDWEEGTIVLISKEPKRGTREPMKLSAKVLAEFGPETVAEVEGGTNRHTPNFEGEDVQYDSLRVKLANVVFPKSPG
ncbi:MAG: hypothetical protein WCT54_02830 [Patescibacteria group bacterium]